MIKFIQLKNEKTKTLNNIISDDTQLFLSDNDVKTLVKDIINYRSDLVRDVIREENLINKIYDLPEVVESEDEK